MKEQDDRIRAVNQALEDYERKARSKYNRTVYLRGRLVANNALKVEFSTALQLHAHPHFIPRTPQEKDEVKQLVIRKAVEQARQMTANDLIPAVKADAEELLGETLTFDILDGSEKWYVEKVTQFNRSEMAHFQYHATFLF